MASSSPLPDLTEDFFLCSVCLNQLKEPKQLTCLHRYCRDCLNKIISGTTERTFKCPICKKIYEVPKDGIDGFKTDFHMKSMLEFIKLQKSFENTDFRECVGCSKELRISSYCIKCNVFLCDQCGQYHQDNIMFKDHREHVLNLENMGSKEVMLEILTSITSNPRCNHHVEQEGLLCCVTCGNMPVCIFCVFGKHKGHDFHDVAEEAERERESLQVKLHDVKVHKGKLYQLPKDIDKAIIKLKRNVKSESEKINFQYEQQVEKIGDKMKKAETEREKTKENIKTKREKEMEETRRKHDVELKQIVEKYDHELNKSDKAHDQIMEDLKRKRESLDDHLKMLTAEKEEISKQNEIELQNISQDCEQIIKRYERLTTSTSSILASHDKWVHVQCIPDMKAASKVLLEEIDENFSKVESLSKFKIDNLINIVVDVVHITDKYESVIDIDSFKTNGCEINSVSKVSDGHLVITGDAYGGYSHITVIDRDGNIQRHQKTLSSFAFYPSRYCCRLSDLEVVTLCNCYEIGIYDNRDLSCISKNIRRVTPNSSLLRCVTTDPVHDHIIVGTVGRDVLVFDDQLKYMKTIQLPGKARYQVDICVHRGNLLVCSDEGSAFSVTLDGRSSDHLLYELPKPDIVGGYFTPLNVCTDKNQFIYILWRTYISGQAGRSLTQYSPDGRKILTYIPVDENSTCMATTDQDDGEFLVVATRDTGKLYTYRLLEN